MEGEDLAEHVVAAICDEGDVEPHPRSLPQLLLHGLYPGLTDVLANSRTPLVFQYY